MEAIIQEGGERDFQGLADLESLDASLQASSEGLPQATTKFDRRLTPNASREQITPFFFEPRSPSQDERHCWRGVKNVGDQPKPDIVVRVVAVVPVVIGDAGVVVIVVPRAATQQTVFF